MSRDLLFGLNINVLNKYYVISLCQSVCTKYKFYADDTVLYASDVDKLAAHGKVQQDLNRVNEWCCLNKITMNIKKTKSMVFGTRNMQING